MGITDITLTAPSTMPHFSFSVNTLCEGERTGSWLALVHQPDAARSMAIAPKVPDTELSSCSSSHRDGFASGRRRRRHLVEPGRGHEPPLAHAEQQRRDAPAGRKRGLRLVARLLAHHHAPVAGHGGHVDEARLVAVRCAAGACPVKALAGRNGCPPRAAPPGTSQGAVAGHGGRVHVASPHRHAFRTCCLSFWVWA